MRISKTFGERKHVLPSDNPKKKYFFAYEGSETERLYFDGIKAIKNKLGINALLEIVPLLRSCCEAGWSHPIRLLSCLMEFLQQMQEGQYKISSIIEWTIDYLINENIVVGAGMSEDEIRRYLIEWFASKGELLPENTTASLEEIIEQVAASLQEKVPIYECVEKLKQHLKEQTVTYDPTYDCVCVIVDRDRQSFKEDQYDCVKNTCAKEGFQLYVTNPCFEFWLLLHFDEVFNLDLEKIKGNIKVTGKRRYTEDELRKLVNGYKKNNIQFPVFASRIDKAISNEKCFAEDLSVLKDSVGSNVGRLIAELR